MKAGRVFKVITRNWAAKLFCFAIAVVVVLFNRMGKIEDRTMNIPFKLYTNSEYLVVQDIPRTIKVTLRGNKDDIYSILSSDLTAFADFTAVAETGNYSRPIKIERSGSALYITPLEIHTTPNQINLAFARKTIKRIPLEPVVRGTPAEGYELSGTLLSPNFVTVEGPESVLDTITSFKTTSVDLDGHSDNFSVQVGVETNNKFVRLINSDVRLSLSIAKIMVVRTVQNVTILLAHCPDDLTAVPNVQAGSIKLEVNSQRADTISASSMKLVAELGNLSGPGTYILPLKPAIPKNMNMVGFSPDTVEVTVSSKNITPSPDAPAEPATAAPAASASEAPAPEAAAPAEKPAQ
ncbi:MAG: YbbR-like domain-containing protein [Spirochaetia bacterium]|nr:YbbR-like domain-containing protein [Spirochaetia bacterium]